MENLSKTFILILVVETVFSNLKVEEREEREKAIFTTDTKLQNIQRVRLIWIIFPFFSLTLWLHRYLLMSYKF